MRANKKEKLTFYSIPPDTNGLAPLASERIRAGFPSPAENYMEGQLDLNSYLVKNPPATFFVRVDGDSMMNAGIFTGDILIVDRSIEAQNNDIIIGIINGEFTVKRLVVSGDKLKLMPENPAYKPIEIKEGMDFEVWGKVTSVIHQV